MNCCSNEISQATWRKVDHVISRHKNTPGTLITVLREAQEIVGWFPHKLIEHIAAGMNIPASDVFGVVSFYSLFSLTPKGRHSIKVCTGTACYVKGAREVIGRISSEHKITEGETTKDQRFDLEGVRCVGACGLAPAMVIDGDVHGDVTADSVLKILEKYS